MDTKTRDCQPADDRADDAALMYPDNQLKDQVHEFEDTQSVFSVMRETFFAEK